MRIISGVVSGVSHLARLQFELSREAKGRLKWLEYYNSHGCNARLTIQAHGKVSAVLQRGYEIREGETTFKLTKELLPDFSNAIEDEGRAIAKLQEISNKLRELSQ